jgi:hypothetical protein
MADAQDSRKAWFFIETELLAIHRLRNLSHERVVRISQGSKARLPACCLPPASDANPCKCLPCPLAKVPLANAYEQCQRQGKKEQEPAAAANDGDMAEFERVALSLLCLTCPLARQASRRVYVLALVRLA